MFCAGLGVQLVGDGAQHVGQDDDQGLQQTLAPAPTPVTLTTTLIHQATGHPSQQSTAGQTGGSTSVVYYPARKP